MFHRQIRFFMLHPQDHLQNCHDRKCLGCSITFLCKCQKRSPERCMTCVCKCKRRSPERSMTVCVCASAREDPSVACKRRAQSVFKLTWTLLPHPTKSPAPMHRINHPQPQIIRNIVLRVSRHVNGFSDHACTRYLAVVSISCRLVLMRSYFQHLWEMRKLPGLSAACNFALSVEHSKISRRQVLATFGRLQIWLIASKQIKWMEKGLGTGASQDKKSSR